MLSHLFMVQRISRVPKPHPRFIAPMECQSVANLPEGEQWVYEPLCGPPHNTSSVALHVMWRSAYEGNERSIQLSASAT